MCIHGETDGRRRIEWLWFICINNFFSSVYDAVFRVIQIHSWNKNFYSPGEKKLVVPSETWQKCYRNVVYCAKFWRKKNATLCSEYLTKGRSLRNVLSTVWVHSINHLLWFMFGLQEWFFLANLCIFPSGISLLYFFLLVACGFKFCIPLLPISDQVFFVNIS